MTSEQSLHVGIGPTSSDLPDFTAVGGALLYASAELVAAKYAAEAARRTSVGCLLDRAIPDSGYETIDSFAFARACLPFLELPSGPARPLRVPTVCVLGESWRWRPENVDPKDVDALKAFLLDDERSCSSADECSSQFGWPALGLAIAHEGKNRIAFLRHIGAVSMPASVSCIDYPCADRISLYVVQVHGREEVWGVLDDRWVEPIPLYSLGKAVLAAYGVSPVGRWPQQFPPPELVLDACAFGAGRPDISRILAAHQRRQESVTVALCDVPGIKPQYKRWVILWLALFGSAAVLYGFGDAASKVACVLFGAGAGAFIFWQLRWFTARRG
jgi:hypothetical protein